MIHILMSIGFSVDFSAHICAAYLMSDRPLRQDRARYALVHASGPIFNGGMSSLVGVSMLLFSESYFFRTFFKIMSMVITAGAINSVFFMPIVLSYIGPESPDLPKQPRRSMVAKLAAINEREREHPEGAGDQNVSASCDCRYASGPSQALSGTDPGPRQALTPPETSVAGYSDDQVPPHQVPPHQVPPHQNVSASCDCQYASCPNQALSGTDPGPSQVLTLPETSIAGYRDGHVPHPAVDAVNLLPNSRARSLVDPEGLGSTLKKPASPSSEAGSVAVLSACFPTSIVYHAVSVAPPPAPAAAAAAAVSLTDGEEVDENHNSQETAGAQRCGRSCLKSDEPAGAKDPGVPLTGALPQGVGTDAAETGGENSIPIRGVTAADVLASGDSDAEYGDVGASVQGLSTVSDDGVLLRQHTTDNDDGAPSRQHTTDNDDGAHSHQHTTDNDDGAHSHQHTTDNDDGAHSHQHTTDNDDGAHSHQHTTDNDDGAHSHQHTTDNDDGAHSHQHTTDNDDGAHSHQHTTDNDDGAHSHQHTTDNDDGAHSHQHTTDNDDGAHSHQHTTDNDDGAHSHQHTTDNDDGAHSHQHTTDNDDGAHSHQHTTDNDDGAHSHQHTTDNDDGAHSHQHTTDNDDGAHSHQHTTDNDDGAHSRQHSTDRDDGAHSHQHSTDNDGGASSRQHSTDNDGGAHSRQHPTDNDGGAHSRQHSTDRDDGASPRQHVNTSAPARGESEHRSPIVS